MEESVQNQITRLATLKVKPYKKFIKALLKIEEQGLVPEKSYRKIRSLFQGQSALYLKQECAEAISTHLMAIGRCVGRGNENSRLGEELRPPVLAIINVLMDNMGFGGKLDETVIEEMEKEEDAFFPQLFRQAIKEALDNVLVNYSDYCLFNRGEYEKKEDGEYLVFPLINDRPPYGCKIMIGPFTNKKDTKILLQMYVPQYIHEEIADMLLSPRMEKELDDRSYRSDRVVRLSSYMKEEGWGDFMRIFVDGQGMPVSVSIPLDDSCLIKLELEDCYNAYIPSFSFDDRDSCAAYRRNYTEIAFVLGQRVKYNFLEAWVFPGLIHIYDYIAGLRDIIGGFFSDPLPEDCLKFGAPASEMKTAKSVENSGNCPNCGASVSPTEDVCEECGILLSEL
jgi:hypothetical protein